MYKPTITLSCVVSCLMSEWFIYRQLGRAQNAQNTNSAIISTIFTSFAALYGLLSDGASFTEACGLHGAVPEAVYVIQGRSS